MTDVLTEQPHLDGSGRTTTGSRSTSGRARAQRAKPDGDTAMPAAPVTPTVSGAAEAIAPTAHIADRALAASGAGSLAVGDRVDVRRRFDEEWASGFEVAEAVADGYRVRRRSDGDVLPTVFAADAVRAERRRRRNMWWY